MPLYALLFLFQELKVVEFKLHQITLSVLVVNHVHVLSVLSILRGEVGCSMLFCKSWLWWLHGYWKGRFLNWKAWLQKLCISSHFAFQTCLKMFPFNKCTITCTLLMVQGARAVTIQCHWWQLLPYKMCWEVCFVKSTRNADAFLCITWSCLLYFSLWGKRRTALYVF